MKSLLVALCLAVLLGGATRKPTNFVDIPRILAASEAEARKAMAAPKCQAAFATHLPEYGTSLDVLKSFESVKLHPVEWIVDLRHGIGAVNCDLSRDTMILSWGYIGWIGVEGGAEAIIHEYVHLLRCSKMIKECGSQANCAPSFMIKQERAAYKISRICIGREEK